VKPGLPGAMAVGSSGELIKGTGLDCAAATEEINTISEKAETAKRFWQARAGVNSARRISIRICDCPQVIGLMQRGECA
jgi:hypothetical protein